jgi:hypothetical protein
MPTVAITHNEDVSVAIITALKHFDLEPLVKNKFVAVKPNETWASAEDLTAVTQAA